jgi:L-serine dehydratase
MILAKCASISGAEGGCQAEVGSASAMAACALTEIFDGTPQMVSHSCAIALKNILGLVCDPVAGLVEIPCIKRNAMGVANAFTASELACAGIPSAIPADEVILAMKRVGKQISPSLKETAEGGLAATPTARNICKRIFGQ